MSVFMKRFLHWARNRAMTIKGVDGVTAIRHTAHLNNTTGRLQSLFDADQQVRLTMMETSFGSPNRPPPMASTKVASPELNTTIDTNYISVDPGDTSTCAKMTRLVISCTSRIFTPRQVLMMIRTLQTFTFAILVFTVLADLMYLVFVSLASTEVNVKVGGVRDAIIRVYGLAMTIMALMIQFDVASFLKYFSGLRGYVPRSLLLFFIATITSPNPLHAEYAFNRNKNEGTDDNFDDYYVGDDQVDQQVSAEIPGSTVRFQMVISFLL